MCLKHGWRKRSVLVLSEGQVSPMLCGHCDRNRASASKGKSRACPQPIKWICYISRAIPTLTWAEHGTDLPPQLRERPLASHAGRGRGRVLPRPSVLCSVECIAGTWVLSCREILPSWLELEWAHSKTKQKTAVGWREACRMRPVQGMLLLAFSKELQSISVVGNCYECCFYDSARYWSLWKVSIPRATWTFGKKESF